MSQPDKSSGLYTHRTIGVIESPTHAHVECTCGYESPSVPMDRVGHVTAEHFEDAASSREQKP